VSHLRRLGFWELFPALTGWANFCRAYGAEYERSACDNFAGLPSTCAGPSMLRPYKGNPPLRAGVASIAKPKEPARGRSARDGDES